MVKIWGENFNKDQMRKMTIALVLEMRQALDVGESDVNVISR